jgi:hypothetical protein
MAARPGVPAELERLIARTPGRRQPASRARGGWATHATAMPSVPAPGWRTRTQAAPGLAGGFTRKTFTAMIEGVRDAMIGAGLIKAETLNAGVRAPTGQPEPTACSATPSSTGTGRKPTGKEQPPRSGEPARPARLPLTSRWCRPGSVAASAWPCRRRGSEGSALRARAGRLVADPADLAAEHRFSCRAARSPASAGTSRRAASVRQPSRRRASMQATEKIAQR